MNTSSNVMTVIPFAGNLTIALVAFISIGVAIIAGFVIKDQQSQSRENILQSANENMELEAFGLPIKIQSERKSTAIDTGAILKNEGFQV